MFFQTVAFVGLIPFDGILGKDKIEVVNEHVKQMDCRAVGVPKLFGSFAIDGGGQVALFGKQKLEKDGQGFLKVFEGKFCERSGNRRGTGRLFGLETEGRFEFLPMVFCPFDDMAHVDLSSGQAQQHECEQTRERVGHSLFGAWVGNGLNGGGKPRKGRSGQGKPPCLSGDE